LITYGFIIDIYSYPGVRGNGECTVASYNSNNSKIVLIIFKNNLLLLKLMYVCKNSHLLWSNVYQKHGAMNNIFPMLSI